MEPVTTTTRSVEAVPNRGIVHQTTAAAANQTDVAASTSTAVAVPGGVGTRTTAGAASQGNVAALETTTKLVETSSRSNVPDDPKAHLMFYLKCLKGVLKNFYDICLGILEVNDRDFVDKLIKYKEYAALSTEESDMMLILARTLRPTLFINKCLFENDKMCKNSANKFYKIEQVEKSLAVTDDVIVRGERSSVSEVMYYKSFYMEKHYYGPMAELEYRLHQIDKGLHRLRFSEKYHLHLLFSLLCPFWVVIWIATCFMESD
ncbi:uncharacterized protein LOC130053164 [Ostrea edulis]|uniref:uncharacterized protein LOC130053164 n=1 Tax=Ostrea edulis TaxID=37623 RepID=UPI0024AFB8C1|nr:uncharacterized protein LOC130053164 [Ostrea edulis]